MVAGVQAVLQEQVLPLFRTRMDLVPWRNVRVYGDQARAGLAELEDAGRVEAAGVVLPVVRKAIVSTIAACGRADDSNGEIQDVIGGLLALHADLCRREPPPVGKLVDWMIGFQFDRRRWHDFTLDAADYTDALGPAGLDRYEAALEELAAALPPARTMEERQAAYRAGLHDNDEDQLWAEHVRFHLEDALQRVAVARRDRDLVIARHAGDGTRSYQLLETAEALIEIDATEDAIDYAHRALTADGGPQAVKAGEVWARLLAAHHPEQELAARMEVFTRYPSSSTAGPLHRAASVRDQWEGLEPTVLGRLQGQVRELVVFLLHSLHDPHRAFLAAVEGGLPHARWNDDVWNAVIDQQLALTPAAVVPVIEEQVTQLLQTADAHAYRLAARRLTVLQRAATAAGEPEHAVHVIQQLRQQHRNRPRLQLEFDRARLPPLVRNP